MMPNRKYTDYVTDCRIWLLLVLLYTSDKKKSPQKAESNPSACEASNDGGDKSEHPFEQLIMAEQRKVINV